jgi:dihydropteridine reductase
MNRKGMPGADFTKWTPLETVAELFYDWTVDEQKRPASGSLLILETADDKTTVTPA